MQKILLPVNEIFVSIQGEGLNFGKIALFIRFGKCNLHCEFCDTKYAWNNFELIPEKNIIDILKKNRKITSFLIITGGEPCLYDLQNIIKKAKQFGYTIAVETNGTIYQKWLEMVDWITVSPKNEKIDKKVLKLADELKFVILNKKSFKLVNRFMPFNPVILQPVDNNKKIAKLILKEIQKSKYKKFFRLGIQLQKVYGFK